MNSNKNSRVFKRTAAGALVCSLCAAMLFSAGASALNASAAGRLDDPVLGNYFVSDYNSMSDVNNAVAEYGKQVMEEGVVMLKNDAISQTENALPLRPRSEDGKLYVSMFGKTSVEYDMMNSTVFQNYGITLNPQLLSFYNNNERSGEGRGSYVNYNTELAGKPTGETPWSMYENDTGNVIQSFDDYSDAAVVCLRRYVGEGHDAPQTMYYGEDSNGIFYETSRGGQYADKLMPEAVSADAHYLELDKNERDLLTNVCKNFDNVILVLVTTGPIELEFLNEPALENINAVLWTGSQTGAGGAGTGIARVLAGEVSPSGRTVDTWYKDFAEDPTWQNFGIDRDIHKNTNRFSNIWVYYTIYQEGIYSGYRYYETRGYEEKQADPGSTWYEDNVNYPFGYGLSYTKFDWELISSTPQAGSLLEKDGTLSVTVKVTNTGGVAGKDVVELYYTAPYFKGEIEKAHVVLCGFEKTKLLQPGHSQELTITLNVRDMASYDYSDANENGFKGYELDAGSYEIKLMRNSHDVVESIGYNIGENYKYPSGVTGNENDNNLFDESSDFVTFNGYKYMSREDFEGTFPTTITGLEATGEYYEELTSWNGAGGPPADEGQPYYSDTAPAVAQTELTEADDPIRLEQLFGKAYNDPLWEEYLDQFTEQQLIDLSAHGRYYSGRDYPALGVSLEMNIDGSDGLSNYPFHAEEFGELNASGIGATAVLAATWNKELAYRKGELIGNQSLWGSTKDGKRKTVVGWYAPAVNVHRSPFGGRNAEYYSEDGYFTGAMAAPTVEAARNYGVVTYVKHFAMNDADTYRSNGTMWADEQTMREVYFKGFEMCVKQGNTLGIMSATCRVGAVWAGGNYNLITKLLREEWGFEGCVVTDYVDPESFSSYDQMIRAGGNLILADAQLKYYKGTPTTLTALRNAAHGLLYSLANSNAVNTADGDPVMPATISSFEGCELTRGIINVPYTGSVATAEINSFYGDLTEDEITYALAENSTPLPEGLVLNSDGTVTGTPLTAVSNSRITVVATCRGQSMTASFITNVTNGDPEIIYSAGNIASAGLGKPYTATVATASIFAPNASEEEIAQLPEISYALANGSSLPAGLQLGSDGTISGTPKFAVKDFTFSVTATAEGLASKTVEYKFSVLGELTFGTGTLEAGKYGQSYVGRITPATGGEGITYALKEGSALPGGLTLTAGGYIVGTPTQAVTNHKFTVVAVCDTAPAQEAEYSITIGINYNVAALTVPDGSAGTSYDTRIDMAQGAGDVTYKIVGGELPEGLTLTPDGAITGTPGQAGVFTVTVEAEAEGIASDRTELTLYIAGNASGTDTWFVLCISVVAALIVVSVVAGIVAGKSGRSGSKGGRR